MTDLLLILIAMTLGMIMFVLSFIVLAWQQGAGDVMIRNIARALGIEEALDDDYGRVQRKD